MTNHDLLGRSREEIVAALRLLLPHLPADDTALSPTIGGRVAAIAALAGISPQAYERNRNFLDGDVTRLSAYLRHGVLTLPEVRDAALGKVNDPAKAGKLINEFAWRDYWQRLYVQLGEGFGRTGRRTRRATRLGSTPPTCRKTSATEPPRSRAWIALHSISRRRATFTIMPACGWRLTWFTGVAFVGRPGRAGFWST